MTLLGQHGQRLDYQRGVDLIRYSAQTADENAPQGAYVSLSGIGIEMRALILKFFAGLWHVTSS